MTSIERTARGHCHSTVVYSDGHACIAVAMVVANVTHASRNSARLLAVQCPKCAATRRVSVDV